MRVKTTASDSKVYKALCALESTTGAWPGYEPVAMRTGLAAGTVWSSLQRMEKAGYIRRLYNNRRMTGVRIEATGKILKSASDRMTFKKLARKYCGENPRVPHETIPDHVMDFQTVTETDGCRYPFGYREYVYCGRPRHGKSSYCADHHAKCCLPAPQETASAAAAREDDRFDSRAARPDENWGWL